MQLPVLLNACGSILLQSCSGSASMVLAAPVAQLCLVCTQNTCQSGLCCSMAAATIPVRRFSCRICGCEAVALVILYEMG